MDRSSSIFLVRHGEAAAAWGEDADPSLSSLGRDQAIAASKSLIEHLATAGPTLISSPLARAQETAAPLAAALSLAVTVDARFREVPAPVPLEQRQGWLRALMRERWEDQGQPVQAWHDALIQAVSELRPGSVVFTHFLVINAVVGALQGRAETLVCWPANASITELRRSASGLELVQIGEQMKSRVN